MESGRVSTTFNQGLARAGKLRSVSTPDPFGLVGQVLDGQFRVDRFIGEGGFSVVYAGQHLGLSEPCAIKCMKLPAQLSSALVETFVQRFRDESRLHYKLSQGNLHIVRTIAAGTTVSPVTRALVPYMVLEWLDGRSVAAELEKSPRPRSLAETLTLFDTAVDALAYAQAQGVVHRDLNPGNFFLTETAAGVRVKVLDFGVAKVLDESRLAIGPRVQTMGQIRIFAPAYGAPEQFDDNLGKVGPATDVYALALVLLEVMSGRSVMNGEHLGDFALAALDPAKRPSSRDVGLTLPAEVDAVMARAFALRPQDRWPTVKDFWAALRMAARVPVGKDDEGGNPTMMLATMPLSALSGGPKPGAEDTSVLAVSDDVVKGSMPSSPDLERTAVAEVVEDAPPRTERLGAHALAPVAPVASVAPVAPVALVALAPSGPLQAPVAAAPALAPTVPGPDPVASPAAASVSGAEVAAVLASVLETQVAGTALLPAMTPAQVSQMSQASQVSQPSQASQVSPLSAIRSPSSPELSAGFRVSTPFPVQDAEAAFGATLAVGASFPLPGASAPPAGPPPMSAAQRPSSPPAAAAVSAVPAAFNANATVALPRAPLAGTNEVSQASAPNVPAPSPPKQGDRSQLVTLAMATRPSLVGLEGRSSQPPEAPAPAAARPESGLGSTMVMGDASMAMARAQAMVHANANERISSVPELPQAAVDRSSNLASAPAPVPLPVPGAALAVVPREPAPPPAFAKDDSAVGAPVGSGRSAGLIVGIVAALVLVLVAVVALAFYLRKPSAADAPTGPTTADTPAIVTTTTFAPSSQGPSASAPSETASAPAPSDPAPTATGSSEPAPSATTTTSASAAGSPATPPSATPKPNATPSAKPSAAPLDPNVFDPAMARTKLDYANGVLAICKKSDGPSGKGNARVTFAPNGSPSVVSIEPPFENTAVGTCVRGQLMRAKTSPFQGTPQTIPYTFTVPK